MAQPITTKKRAKALSLALFLIGLAVITYFNAWWPAIMLVIGVPLALRQYLLGRPYDTVVSLIVFVGVFITVHFEVSWRVLLPVLFMLGAIYIFFREYVETDATPLSEEEDELNLEVEEEAEETEAKRKRKTSSKKKK